MKKRVSVRGETSRATELPSGGHLPGPTCKEVNDYGSG